MSRLSFTLKSNLGGAASTTGSFLQAASVNYGADNPSALKADGYVTTPETAVGTDSFLSVTPTNYDEVSIEWSIASTLATTITATPAITSLTICYSLLGPPQTLAEGLALDLEINAANSTSSEPYIHENLPSGKWIYYTLFAKYQSTDTRSWYERIVSTEVLVPKDYGYTDNLYRRIPLHYRIQDEQIGITNLNSPYLLDLPEALRVSGPLRRMLDVFGWEINVIRTIIDYVITQKDPFVANSEMIEQLAVDVGLPLTVADLGTAKLRELIADFTYLTQNEGLLTGVEEYITAITGCNTRINTTQADLLTSTHHAMTSASVTTSASAVPATNQWLLQSSAHTMTGTSSFSYSSMFSETKALAITHTTGASVQMACLKTKVQSVSQASRLYMDFGATYAGSASAGASVVGAWLGPSVMAASVVTPTIYRTNLCSNPSFETNASGWGSISNASVGTVAATWGSGAQVLQVTCNNASANGAFVGNDGFSAYAVTGGLTYTVSIYAKHISGTPRNVNVIYLWSRPTGNTYGGSGATVTLSATPQRVSATGVAPADATGLTIWIQCDTSGTTTAADISQWDMCLLEQSSTVNNYITKYYVSDYTSTLDNFIKIESAGVGGSTSVFEYPVTLGVCGNGSLGTTDMYLHIWIASQLVDNPGILYFIPHKVTTLNSYPYYIDVYSRRLNLVRDPQFTAAISTVSQSTNTTSYWRAEPDTGTVTTSVTSRIATITPSVSTSVNLSTDVTHTTYGVQYTPISKYTDYFFSIDDYNDNITQVAIKNFSKSVTLSSATTPYFEKDSGTGFTRKYWKLELENGDPWYPTNSYKYHIQITASATTTKPLKVSRPLLEPSSFGDYFDGNSDNGGWLGGAGTPGAADYRWGGSVAHINFSYYTADYRRIVETTKRMIPYIVPVTETDYALASLRFNRIPGYTESGQP